MKISLKCLLLLVAILTATNTFAQVGIGTNTPSASAALEVASSTNNKGILIPRITATQKDAISNPAEGLMIFQTSAPAGFYFYTGSAWKLIMTQTDLDTKLSTVDATLSLNTKVDKVTGKDLSSNDYTSAEKTKLAAITGSNSGDQDLSALATIASVALKAPIASPVFTGTPSLPSGTTAITQATADNSTKLATTAYADAAAASALASSGVANNSVSSAKIADGTIATADIANAAITNEKIAAVAASKITGVIPVSSGGTGQTTVPGILSILGFAGNNIAIGGGAGTPNQGVNANTIAIGGGAGRGNQGAASVAIGYVSGDQNQGSASVAIGPNAAQSGQGTQAVAIGYAAGQNGQGAYSVAVGSFAGNSQVANSIALNASGNNLNPANAGFYVDPIRSASNTGVLLYNTTTKEVTTSANISGNATNVTGTVAVANGGTGASTLTANNVLLGNGAGSLQAVAPGTSGNVLTSNGTTWTSAAVSGGLPTGNNPGDMLYWNNTAWVKVPAGTNGQTLTFYNGAPSWTGTISYANTVLTTTGKTWMDRNLGASQVAGASNDAASYGDLYQWGRGTDGHQLRTSATTTSLSNSYNPGNANFILASADWRSSQNDNLWQGVNGINNPCPSGYRIPTDAEWATEHTSWTSQKAAGAIASPLKLPMAGYREFRDGSVYSVGTGGFYWSSTDSGSPNSKMLFFDSGSASTQTYNRAYGFSVRCLKD